MAEQDLIYSDRSLTSMTLGFAGLPDHMLDQFTPMEVMLGESLHTPGLQTSIRVHSYHHNLPIKNLDTFKGVGVSVELEKLINSAFGLPTKMLVNQTVYRLSNRRLYNNNTEEFIIHACHQTLLDDAVTLVSNFWRCSTPTDVAVEVLRSCAGARHIDSDPSSPGRGYLAENIHPFQVVSQQANAALYGGNDPSFIHYMTYKIDDGDGIHHFRSLKSLTQSSPVTKPFEFYESGTTAGGFSNPFAIITHSFPCDFDLLIDLLNGVDINGADISTVLAFNPLVRGFSQLGSQTLGCGIGSGPVKITLSNISSAKDQDACPDYSHLFLQKRQARMSLIDNNRIALRLTVPWNPLLHAGNIIRLELKNKNDTQKFNYGTGDYLIVSMTHNIKYGGYATTTLDCVSKSVGRGVV